MTFTLIIGSTNFSSYVATDGFKWERNDIDAPDSGRDMNGTMRRKIIARKDKIQITCRSLRPAELSTLTNALSNATMSVTYTVPGQSTRTAEFYNSKKTAGIVQDLGNNVMTYSGVSFDLIEV